MFWVVFNITTSLIMAPLGAYLIGAYGHKFNWLERLGITTLAAGVLLTVGPILSRNELVEGVSPYDDWSGALMRVGGMLAFAGIIARLEGFARKETLSVEPGEGLIGRWRHRRANEKAKREAEQYLRNRRRARQ